MILHHRKLQNQLNHLTNSVKKFNFFVKWLSIFLCVIPDFILMEPINTSEPLEFLFSNCRHFFEKTINNSFYRTNCQIMVSNCNDFASQEAIESTELLDFFLRVGKTCMGSISKI